VRLAMLCSPSAHITNFIDMVAMCLRACVLTRIPPPLSPQQCTQSRLAVDSEGECPGRAGDAGGEYGANSEDVKIDPSHITSYYIRCYLMSGTGLEPVTSCV